MAYAEALLVNNSTGIIENSIAIEDDETYVPPSGYSIYPLNGQQVSEVYDPLFYYADFANTTTGLYVGNYPYNAYPSGSAETVSPPPDTHMSYNFATDVWYWSKPALKVKVMNRRKAVQANNITVDGEPLIINTEALAISNLLMDQAQTQVGTALRAFTNANFNCDDFTNTEMLSLYHGVQDHYQRCFDAEKMLCDDIDSDTITVPDSITTQFSDTYDYLVAHPISRAALPDISAAVQTALDGKAALSHTHVANDITDATTVGKNVLKATDATAARTAIGAGTSSFSGAYSALTGTPTIPTTFDNLTDGTTNKAFTSSLKTKLDGIASGATANDTDANLKARANHTGTQAASTITGLATVATTGAYADLSGKPTVPTTFDNLTDGTTNKAYTATEKTKLSGIATAATANDTDANLKNRANHTGSQAISTVTNLQATLDQKPDAWFGNTLKTAPKFYTASATVGSGVAVYYLTTDGTSTGTALMTLPNLDSLNYFVNDAAASYQVSGALSNSNKTLTLTVNKLTTANILTGILGQAAANGAVIKVTIWGQ